MAGIPIAIVRGWFMGVIEKTVIHWAIFGSVSLFCVFLLDVPPLKRDMKSTRVNWK